MTEMRYPLRDTTKRMSIIKDINNRAKKLGIPVEVDLREYHYSELILARIKLELADVE